MGARARRCRRRSAGLRTEDQRRESARDVVPGEGLDDIAGGSRGMEILPLFIQDASHDNRVEGPKLAKKLIRRLDSDRMEVVGAREEVSLVACDDHVRADVNGRGEHMAIAWVVLHLRDEGF